MMLNFLLCLLLVSVTSAPMARAGVPRCTEAELLEAIREKPYRAAGGLHIYEVPALEETPAPKGYNPFYISHLSRHGSRTQTSETRPFKCLAELDSLQALGLLSASGDSLLKELHLIHEAHKGRAGMLTQVGEREQGGVGSRMARRYPEVFQRKDAVLVACSSTAVSGGSHCADLRFAHDGNLGPLLNALGVEGFNEDIPDDSICTYWQNWKYMCMCSNLQMIFYRNRIGDVLVKLLRNEQETRIPALAAVSGPYYRWKELRRYMLCQSGNITELSDECKTYLQEKADRIAKLQKNEADGFWFITDMHFPENRGLSAPALEYLQTLCRARKLFFGGDMIASVHDVMEGWLPQDEAFMQIKGSSEVFLLRGNHDITTHTGKESWAQETVSQLETEKWFRSVSSPKAVYNSTGTYFYYDHPLSRIRYVGFDTTDSVVDGKIRYGTSEEQLTWMREQAVRTLPKGWKLFFLSHVPLCNVYKSGALMAGARKIVEEAAKNNTVLMVLSGHRHKDLDERIGQVPQVITRSDGKNDPSLPLGGACFDYVSISRDYSRVTMVRIGVGDDRKY